MQFIDGGGVRNHLACTEVAGRSPVLRRNPPACGRLLAQPRVRFWPALGLAGLSPVVVRGWRRSEGGAEEQGGQRSVGKEKKKRRENVGGGHA